MLHNYQTYKIILGFRAHIKNAISMQNLNESNWNYSKYFFLCVSSLQNKSKEPVFTNLAKPVFMLQQI